jgi:hypothetical protein
MPRFCGQEGLGGSRQRMQRGGFPGSHSLTYCVQARRRCQRAVWMEADCVDGPAVPLLLQQARPRLHVPQPPGHVITGSGLCTGGGHACKHEGK